MLIYGTVSAPAPAPLSATPSSPLSPPPPPPALRQGAVAKRNADFAQIAGGLAFPPLDGALGSPGFPAYVAAPGQGGGPAAGGGGGGAPNCHPADGPALKESELVVWAGDLNYRVELTYEEVGATKRRKKGKGAAD